ncbi:hypothetical protein GQ472_03990 [archaeon]|nr:hypothetical protein [archaeon]
MVQNLHDNDIAVWIKDQFAKGYDQQTIRQRLLNSGYDISAIDNMMTEQNKSNIESENIETDNLQDTITKKIKNKTLWSKGIIVLISIILLISLFTIFSEDNIINQNEQTNQEVSALYNSFFENEYCDVEINESFDFNNDICDVRVTYKNNLLINNSKGVYSINYNSFQEDIQKETGDMYKYVKGDLYNITAISITQLALFSIYTPFFKSYFIYDTDDALKDKYYKKIFSEDTLSYPKMIEINKTENSEELMSFCFTAFNTYLNLTRSIIFDDNYPARDDYTNIDYIFFEDFVESNIDINDDIIEVYDNNLYNLEPFWTNYGQYLKVACMDRIKEINSRLTIQSVTFDNKIIQIHLENTGQSDISLNKSDYIIDGRFLTPRSCEITKLLINEKTVCKIDTTKFKTDINKTSNFKIKIISDDGVIADFEYEGE